MEPQLIAIRADGFTAIVHRPKKRETDFADEWVASQSVVTGSVAGYRDASRAVSTLSI